jgi:hypothetical protein
LFSRSQATALYWWPQASKQFQSSAAWKSCGKPAVQWVSRFIYAAVALMIAYRLVQFWTGYFKQIEDAGGFDFERAAASAATRRLKRRRILFPPKRN